jgi:hypothetical protein
MVKRHLQNLEKREKKNEVLKKDLKESEKVCKNHGIEGYRKIAMEESILPLFNVEASES